MKKLFPKLKPAIFIFALFILASVLVLPARAEDAIDVEYPVGTNINGDNIFHADNIAPGWSESKTIRVANQSATDAVNLYFTFNVKGDKKLAEKLKLYVIRVSDNSYRIGGAGDRWNLEKADEKNLYTDKLSSGESKQYEIKIKFDENAGNEYQDLEADFDIDFIIESEIAQGGGTASTESAILAEQGRSGFTGDEGSPTEEAGVQGEETQREAGAVENTISIRDFLKWIVPALLLTWLLWWWKRRRNHTT